MRTHQIRFLYKKNWHYIFVFRNDSKLNCSCSKSNSRTSQAHKTSLAKTLCYCMFHFWCRWCSCRGATMNATCARVPECGALFVFIFFLFLSPLQPVSHFSKNLKCLTRFPKSVRAGFASRTSSDPPPARRYTRERENVDIKHELLLPDPLERWDSFLS